MNNFNDKINEIIKFISKSDKKIYLPIIVKEAHNNSNEYY